MSTEQLEKLFMQIDVDLDGMIDWDDFSSYLLLRSEGQKLMKDSNDGNLVDKEGNGKKTYATHHKEMIIKVESYLIERPSHFCRCNTSSH